MFTGSRCSLALHYIRQKLQNHTLGYFYEQVHRFVTLKILIFGKQQREQLQFQTTEFF